MKIGVLGPVPDQDHWSLSVGGGWTKLKVMDIPILRKKIYIRILSLSANLYLFLLVTLT